MLRIAATAFLGVAVMGGRVYFTPHLNDAERTPVAWKGKPGQAPPASGRPNQDHKLEATKDSKGDWAAADEDDKGRPSYKSIRRRISEGCTCDFGTDDAGNELTIADLLDSEITREDLENLHIDNVDAPTTAL